MGQLVFIILLSLSALSLERQAITPQIFVYEDESLNKVEVCKIGLIDSLAESDVFKGIAKRWTLLLEFTYNSKNYQIPIDSSVKSIILVPNNNAEGACSTILHWTACDVLTFHEHGNGCTEMNSVIFNRCDTTGSIEHIDGSRRTPFYYNIHKK